MHSKNSYLMGVGILTQMCTAFWLANGCFGGDFLSCDIFIAPWLINISSTHCNSFVCLPLAHKWKMEETHLFYTSDNRRHIFNFIFTKFSIWLANPLHRALWSCILKLVWLPHSALHGAMEGRMLWNELCAIVLKAMFKIHLALHKSSAELYRNI